MKKFKSSAYLLSCVKFAVWLLWLLFIGSKAFSQTLSFTDSVSIVITRNSPKQVVTDIRLDTMSFTKRADNKIDIGLVGSDFHYAVLKLTSRDADVEKYISVDNTSLDTVLIFAINEHGLTNLIYQGGQLIPFDINRKYVWHQVLVQINTKPSYYLIAVKAAHKNINFRYEILSAENLHQKYQDHDRIIFFYTGVVCLIVIIILLAFFLFRQPVFAAYLGYILSAFTWIFSHYGYMFAYVYPRMPFINEVIKPVSSLGAAFFLLIVMKLVFRKQLQSGKQLLQLTTTMLYILPMVIACMFLFLIPGLHYIVINILIGAWHTALVFSLFLVAYTPVRFIKSGATAKIFSTAMFIICSVSIVQLVANFGGINNFFIGEHGITMGSLSENIIIAFGLFYNLLQERKQREEQVLALELVQADTLKKLITVQDNERKRIAGDLHDNIGPLLAALKINFRRIINTKGRSQLNGLATKTELIIDDSIAEIHNLALNLMPKGLSSNGLINTLHEYFESIEQLYHKTIVFRHQIDSILNPDVQINLYRIICELSLNSAKHSNALNITVFINANSKWVALEIGDDGKGFQLKPGENKNSLGLQNTEDRVAYLNGTFNIISENGKGTHINIELPL